MRVSSDKTCFRYSFYNHWKLQILGKLFTLIIFLYISLIECQESKFKDDICGHINGQRIYLEYGESGTLEAEYSNNIFDKFTKSTNNSQKRCTVEFVSCPSCVIKIKFTFLNLPRNCGRSTIFDTCGCDYVWVYEPASEQSSEQFCGRFMYSNSSMVKYHSQTRKVVVVFYYSKEYNHAFNLEYFAERNKIILRGFPRFGNMNNDTQVLSSPFFPSSYPSDLTMEHVIKCESGNETCRISLVFTDFLIAHSSIIDFFDWNSERIYVTTGNIFRPPVITTSGPSLVIKFYANGATDLGFKAYYSFILGHISQRQLNPDIDCGGEVNNLGGAITMMNMLNEGLKFFDCIWLIKPPETYLHMKTHLYVKVVNFSGFAGNTELTIRQGLTSNEPIVESVKISLVHFYVTKEREHIATVSRGFYVRLKGIFRPESRLALVYAAFNYKDCLAGSDFLCRNKRCISSLLKCDGFDHCGDNSDELIMICSKDPSDRRQSSNIPHFLFPKAEAFSEIATSTLVFLLCSFGLIGFIFAMVILLYRINLKTRHQRQIQDHIETINAILEEGIGEIEEEIIIPDDPPDYEAPPDYNDVIKSVKEIQSKSNRCSRCKLKRNAANMQFGAEKSDSQGITRSCQTSPTKIPDSPPPGYDTAHQSVSGTSSEHWKQTKTSNGIHSWCEYSSSCSTHTNNLYMNHLIPKPESGKYKYFSDSELTYELYAVHDIVFNSFRLDSRKSRTTDDVDLFI